MYNYTTSYCEPEHVVFAWGPGEGISRHIRFDIKYKCDSIREYTPYIPSILGMRYLRRN